jgi:hypothetical protein
MGVTWRVTWQVRCETMGVTWHVPCHVRHTKRASAALTLAQPPLQVVRSGVLNSIAQRP